MPRSAPPPSRAFIAVSYTFMGVKVAWLFLLVPSLLLTAQRLPAWGALAQLVGAALFVGLYLRLAWSDARRLGPGDAPPVSPFELWWPLAVMTALSLVLAATNGPLWGDCFIYTVVAITGRLRPWPAAAATGVLLAITAVGGLNGVPWPLIGQSLFLIAVVGITVGGLTQALIMNRELRAARHEIAGLAVAEERLRFARDLHDLLGHSLSLIALKSELAGHLIREAPEQAETEIADIETAARTALQEVREAVAGYRQTTLREELQQGDELLRAAGIALTVVGTDDDLPAPVAALFAWGAREGVTNILRHSRARQCAITFVRTASEARMTIENDGPAVTLGATTGNGLSGLAERAAIHMGHLEAGPRPAGGFTVALVVPCAAPVAPRPLMTSYGRRR